ncbi:hypothetical protein HDU67_000266 [Dinochytrium kinnereticum]|nr:hypothetical protein HDU67_000266 [Dinochytrium kinnereticum]
MNLQEVETHIRTRFTTRREELPWLDDELFEDILERLLTRIKTERRSSLSRKSIRKILWDSVKDSDPSHCYRDVIDLCFPESLGILGDGSAAVVGKSLLGGGLSKLGRASVDNLSKPPSYADLLSGGRASVGVVVRSTVETSAFPRWDHPEPVQRGDAESTEVILRAVLVNDELETLLKEGLGENLRGLALAIKELIKLKIHALNTSISEVFDKTLWKKLIPQGIRIFRTDGQGRSSQDLADFKGSQLHSQEFQVCIGERVENFDSEITIVEYDIETKANAIITLSKYLLGEPAPIRPTSVAENIVSDLFSEAPIIPRHVQKWMAGGLGTGKGGGGISFWGCDNAFTVECARRVCRHLGLVELDIYETSVKNLTSIFTIAEMVRFDYTVVIHS